MPIEKTIESLPHALGIDTGDELVSIVGGGGKSALLFALGRSLPGRTVMTTTTRIFTAQLARSSLHCTHPSKEFDDAMMAGAGGLLVVGESDGEKTMGVPISVPPQILSAEGVDFVVIEADGSRMRPAKAPAEHEPVVPPETTLLVVVAGIDALARPIEDCCHRPERVSAITGLTLEQHLTPTHLARLLCHHDGGLKNAPPHARVSVFLNKVETREERDLASEVARHCLGKGRIERVVLGALEPCGELAGGNTLDRASSTWRVWLRRGQQ